MTVTEVRRHSLLRIVPWLLFVACETPPPGGVASPPSATDSGILGDAMTWDAADASIGKDTSVPDASKPCEPYEPEEDPFIGDLVGWWTMDGDFEDKSAGGHTCVAVGQARLVNDPQRGSVLELGGDGDYLDCGNDAALDPTQSVTLALWVRVRQFSSEWQAFFSRNGEDCGWSLRRNGKTPVVDFVMRGTNALDDLAGSHPINDNEWHHLAATYDGTRRVVYVDGIVEAEEQDQGLIASCPGDHVLIGAMGAESFGYGHHGHNGWLDDVRIYDKALPPEAILRLAGKGLTAQVPNPSNGAQCVESDTTLRWTPGLGACRHYVYFGTDEATVKTATDPATPPGRGTFDQAQFTPPSLTPQTTYYWRVDEETSEGIIRGPVWSFRLCNEKRGEFVRVPAGTFVMGASPGDGAAARWSDYWGMDIEKPHTVTISHDFWIGATEVTNGEWEAAFGSVPSVFAACGANCPVDSITWHQMIAYCNKRSMAEGYPVCYFSDDEGKVPYDLNAANSKKNPRWPKSVECKGYRLPTESEWEYAARAGTTTPVFLGNATSENVNKIAWFGQNSQCSYPGCELQNCRNPDSGSIPPSGTHPGGSKLPNPWGIYDMSGNLWEYVWDVYGSYPDGPVTDPTGPEVAKTWARVARGGSWLNGTSEARVSAREVDDATCDPEDGPGPHSGFRIVRTAF